LMRASRKSRIIFLISESEKAQSRVVFERSDKSNEAFLLGGYSAVGSALAWHARGHEFDSR
jgi:hypothetical protein